MFVVKFKQHGDLNIQERSFGPFRDYLDAEDALGNGAIPLLYGQGGRPWPKAWEDRPTDGHRFIIEL